MHACKKRWIIIVHMKKDGSTILEEKRELMGKNKSPSKKRVCKSSIGISVS